jgi:hypothetical protein
MTVPLRISAVSTAGGLVISDEIKNMDKLPRRIYHCTERKKMIYRKRGIPAGCKQQVAGNNPMKWT